MSDGTLIRVRDHEGLELSDRGLVTQTESVFIQPQTLEDGLRTIAGRVLLRILRAVDYAGSQRRPVMLIGRKQQAGGMMLHMTVPIETAQRKPPPSVAGEGSPSPNKNGKSTQRGQEFYKA